MMIDEWNNLSLQNLKGDRTRGEELNTAKE